MKNLLFMIVLFALFLAEQSLAQNVHLSAGLLNQSRGEPLKDVLGEAAGGHSLSKIGIALSFPLSDHADIRYEYTYYAIVGTLNEGIAVQGISLDVKLF